jgi:outer membrane lipoprotein-sorting protein
MKKVMLILIFVLVMFSISIAQDLTADQIIKKVNEIFNPETSYGKSKMTIVTTSGKKRTFLSESWSMNKGEKNLVRYLEPRRIKDQAILMLNNADDIWSYFPRTQRVRKLASHAKKQKMQGSDFSYEDMGSGDAFIDDYTPKKLKEEKMAGESCFKLELTRKADSDRSYSRLIMWVVKENFYPIAIDYYDEENAKRKVKRLKQSDIRVIDGFPTAMKAVMYNENDNTTTELEMLEIKYNIELDDNMFTERSLKK